MAGHDVMNLVAMTKTVMVFIKSLNGISQSPGELSLLEDIEKSTISF